MRLKYYRNIYHIVTIASFFSVFVFVMYFIINTETFLMNSYQIKSHDSSPIKYPIYLLPSFIYIFFRILSEKNLNIKIIYSKIQSCKYIEIEVLLALSIILFIVPVQYFKGFQIYLAYIMILSQLRIFDLKYIIKC